MRVDVIIVLSIDFGKDQSMILEIFGKDQWESVSLFQNQASLFGHSSGPA
jgi:hypothetical protein